MEYKYEVPVVVVRYGDELSEYLPAKRSVTDLVVQRMKDWRQFFTDDVENVTVEGRKDRLMIQIVNTDPYSVLDDELYLAQLHGWCEFGSFDGGVTLMGRYYGYSYDEVVVYLSDSKFPILSKTKAPDRV